MVTTGQRSIDDLGTPLHDVTFCVVDLETTGASPHDCGITEVGAVKLRGGECLGTFQTMVDPGSAIPATITLLTGITESMVAPAPGIGAVLPTLLEFIGGSVVVGHNVRFDLAFLAAALDRGGYPALANISVDTCMLARRLLHDEVPDHRLGTLAAHFRLPNQPNHRALHDARATGDLLHRLLERAGSLGVTALDDLLTLPTMGRHPQAAKLRLTEALPRAPGLYLFRGRGGEVLYVGKATNLRSRVRSYFSADRRRRTPALLREAQRIEHHVCTSPLEAAVHEVRLIHRLQPRFNRQGRKRDGYAYVKLTLGERFPRMAVVRDPKDDGALYLGPVPSTGAAQRVVEAVESVVPLRRCRVRLGPRTPRREAPCAPAQLGVATCPCAGAITPAAYAGHVARAVRGLTVSPASLLAPLGERMERLAAAARFEEAADVRDRAAALSSAVQRQRRIDGLRRAGRVVLRWGDGEGVELRDGRLVAAWGPGGAAPEAPVTTPDPDPDPPPSAAAARLPFPAGAAGPDPDRPPPCPRDLADEVLCIARWLDREAQRHEVRIVHADAGLRSELPVLATFQPRHTARDP